MAYFDGRNWVPVYHGIIILYGMDSESRYPRNPVPNDQEALEPIRSDICRRCDFRGPMITVCSLPPSNRKSVETALLL